MGPRTTDARALEAAADRRADSRRPKSQRVRYEIAGVGSGEALCWNLSRGGTCLNLGSSQPVAAVGAQVLLTFDGLSHALTARIAWVKSAGAFHQMGLVFSELTEDQHGWVEQLLR